MVADIFKMRYLHFITALLLWTTTATAQHCATSDTITSDLKNDALEKNYPLKTKVVFENGVEYLFAIAPDRAVGLTFNNEGCAVRYTILSPELVALKIFEKPLNVLFPPEVGA